MGNGRLNAVEILSAEERCFLRGSDSNENERTANAKTKRANRRREATIPGHIARSAVHSDEQVRRTRTMAARQPAPVARGMALQSVTLRLNPQIVRALRRAASERALDYVEPYTQQAIAETALLRWLTDEGYAIKT